MHLILKLKKIKQKKTADAISARIQQRLVFKVPENVAKAAIMTIIDSGIQNFKIEFENKEEEKKQEFCRVWSPSEQKVKKMLLDRKSKITKCGIILRDHRERVLLVRNAHSRKWGFPKGNCEEKDANNRETACREMHEETGIIIKPEKLEIPMKIYDHLLYECDMKMISDVVEPTDPDETIDQKFFTLGEIKKIEPRITTYQIRLYRRFFI
jgi:8-oxo-dGTP pyrophosphatase MutT (NUDIX family)